MANRFMQQGPPVNNYQGSPVSQQNVFQQINELRQNPSAYLANHGINVPQDQQGSYEQIGRYMLNNVPAAQQNRILQTVNGLMGLFGRR